MESKTFYITHKDASIAILTITDSGHFKEVILITLESRYFLNEEPTNIEISSRNQYFGIYPREIENNTIIRAVITRTLSLYKGYNPQEFDWNEI